MVAVKIPWEVGVCYDPTYNIPAQRNVEILLCRISRPGIIREYNVEDHLTNVAPHLSDH